jgi:hypothetical protein
MKKLLLLSALVFGAVSASQAGIHLDIGLPFPHEIIFRAPAPRVYVPAPPVYFEPAPVYDEPQFYAPAPRVVIAPPIVDFRFGGGYYGGYRDCYPRHYSHHDGYYHQRGEREHDRHRW